MRTTPLAWLPCTLALLGTQAPRTTAQGRFPPDSFKNLKVLPKNIGQADVPDRPNPVVIVRCATCHRGVARPRLLEDDLTLTLADSGLEATARRYRGLRDRYYGSGAYDFREIVLNLVARSEAQAGRTDNAIGLLKLNAEFYPTSGQIPFLLGEVYLQRGDSATALGSYRDALAKDSSNAAARQRITALSGGSPR